MFYVPSTPDQRKIPYARLNHNKYMVTDNRAFIGESMSYSLRTGYKIEKYATGSFTITNKFQINQIHLWFGLFSNKANSQTV